MNDRSMELTAEGREAAAALTAREAAARLGVDERTIRRAIARGDLPAAKRAGTFQIAPDELERFRVRRVRGDRWPGGDRDEPAPPSPPSLRLLALPDRLAQAAATRPVAATPLVGRERELAALTDMLRRPEVRLVTLTGPGGVGKTRLALAAAELVGEFADGVWFVGLAAVSDPDLVAPTIGHALGVREAGAEPIAARLQTFLGGQRLLLVLDNVEQVVEAAPLVADLLAACPGLTVLATSRVRLRLSGEHERTVPPLGLVDSDADSSVAAVAQSEAVRFLVARAQAVHPGFFLTPENAPALATICRRLDGLPLAIELAAARIKILPPAALLARLDRRLPLLTGGPRDLPERLRTMRDAIAWSYDLLDAEEQALFRRLAVFVGGFTLDAAEAVGRGAEGRGRRGENVRPSALRPPPSALDLVASLVDKSLLRVAEGDGGETRYGMLETIREFGLERLAASGEEAAVRARHAGWCLAFAEEVGPRAKQPGAAPWIAALEREHPNLRAALGWLAERDDGPELVRMAASLWPFWQERTYSSEGYRWLELALDRGRQAPAADRLRALTGAGTLAWYQTRVEQTRAWHEEALALARQAGDRVTEAYARCNLSGPLAELGDLDGAAASCEAGLAIARAEGETEAMTLALHNLACLAWMRGELATACRRAEEALTLARAHGWDWQVPMILANHGLALADLGDLERAAVLLREGLEQGAARGNFGDVCIAMEGVARVAAATGQAAAAVRWLAAAAALREEIAFPQPPTEVAYFAPVLEGLRAGLGATAFAAAWAAGRALPPSAAVAEALAFETAPTAPSRGVPPPRLTEREWEILRLLAGGASNREIGDKLFISPATVARHLANLYGKLGVDSRAKAVAHAQRLELV